MTKENILAMIEKILVNEIEVEIKNIEAGKTLTELGIDSITFMTLIVYLEDRLSIEIELENGLDEEYSKITIGTLVNNIFEYVK